MLRPYPPEFRQRALDLGGSNRRPSAFQVNRAKRCVNGRH
jgi:hypothetical protein